jgi:hypothetical protein
LNEKGDFLVEHIHDSLAHGFDVGSPAFDGGAEFVITWPRWAGRLHGGGRWLRINGSRIRLRLNGSGCFGFGRYRTGGSLFDRLRILYRCRLLDGGFWGGRFAGTRFAAFGRQRLRLSGSFFHWRRLRWGFPGAWSLLTGCGSRLSGSWFRRSGLSRTFAGNFRLGRSFWSRLWFNRRWRSGLVNDGSWRFRSWSLFYRRFGRRSVWLSGLCRLFDWSWNLFDRPGRGFFNRRFWRGIGRSFWSGKRLDRRFWLSWLGLLRRRVGWSRSFRSWSGGFTFRQVHLELLEICLHLGQIVRDFVLIHECSPEFFNH